MFKDAMSAKLIFLALIVLTAVFFVLRSPKPTPILLSGHMPEDLPGILSEKAYWKKILASHDSKEFYEILKNNYSNNYHKHTVGHIFGDLLYQKEGIKGIDVCDSELYWGCYHSVASQAIAMEGEEGIARLTEICNKKFGGKDSACHHGIGHGIYEYFSGDYTRSLRACTKVSTNGESCYTGVFMEYHFPVKEKDNAFVQEVLPLNSNKVYDPCDKVPEEFKSSCYFELPRWWERVFERDFQKIGLLCSAAPEKYVKNCMEGAGEIISLVTDHNDEETILTCNRLPGGLAAKTCLKSAINGFIASGKTPDKLCQYLENSYKEKCSN